jgi:hypothetical protein
MSTTDFAKYEPKLPSAVTAAVKRADGIMQAQAEARQKAEELPPEVKAEPPQDVPPEYQQKAEPPQDAPQPELKAEPPKDPPKSDDKAPDWERRFNAMKGRYDKAMQEIEGLHRVIASLETRAEPQPTQQSEFKTERLITPEEEEAYGSEFLSVVERKARELIAPMEKNYQNTVKQLENKLESVGQRFQQSDRDRMFSELDSEVNNWRELNKDQEFLDWLQDFDAFSGQQRHVMLKSAYERNDAKRVAAFFKGFLREGAALAPPANHSDQTSQAPKVSLESLAAPGRAKPQAATRAPADNKPIFTRAQIKAFYADAQRGRYKEAEKQQIEAQIFEATAEGRIR